MPPWMFDMRCDKCWGGDISEKGTNIEWSEYAHLIWCYDCEIDTGGFPGIFDGPVPIQTCYLLGLSFDRYNLETNQIERYNLERTSNGETDAWDPPSVWVPIFGRRKERTKRLLRDEYPEDPYGDYLREMGKESFSAPGQLFDLEELLSYWIEREYDASSCRNEI